MTVSSTTTQNSYDGNGSLLEFAYGFKIFDEDDIKVIIRTTSTGAEVVKSKSTHYNVSNVGNASGGNVTFTSGNAPLSSEKVFLVRNTARTQLTDYTPNDPFPADTHEDALDKLTLITQELEQKVEGSLRISQTNAITTPEFTADATARANKLLGFDSSGNVTITEGKIDAVTSSVSAVSAGGTPTASATYTASSGALALAFGLVTGATGATGNSAGIQMTFSTSTSDADPGAGKLALNNGTVASVTEMYFDDVDDNSAAIATFVQSFDDVSNSTARGIIYITKEGTPATFALFKVTGAVTDASGYSKVPVAHLASNGTFSNSDGIRIDFSYSGNDGSGSLTTVVGDTNPELGGDLDVLARDIVSSSNRTIDLAPNGTGTVVVRGNDNSGTIVFNCEDNSHGQTLKAQPHSAGVTNTMLLPAGANSTLVSLVSTDTLTNKTLTSPKINEDVVLTSTATELNQLDGKVAKTAGKESIWVPAPAMYPSTTNPCADIAQVETTALRPDLKVLDFDASSDEFAQFSVAFPKSWNEGTVTFQPFWTVTGTNTGTVAWALSGIAVSSDDTINTAFGTAAVTTALAHSGTSNDLMVSAESGAITIAGSPAAGDCCFFQIARDVSADSQSGDARLLGIKVFFTTDAANDA